MQTCENATVDSGDGRILAFVAFTVGDGKDAPLVVIGGGTNELQRLIIARNLLKKYKVDS